MNKLNDVYITDIAAFMPNRPVSNDEMENILGMVGGKPSRARKLILRNNGIKSRYYVLDPKTRQPKYTNAQLAANAVKKLASDYFSIDQIQGISAGTTVADQFNPGHGVMVHGELENIPCEVITTAGICLSGLAALKYSYFSVLCGDHENSVAVSSEASSLHFKSEYFEGEIEEKVKALEKKPELAFEKDFLRWMLSDGAGAVLIENKPRKGRISLKIDWIDIYSFANEMETCMYAGAQKLEDGSIKGWRNYTLEECNAQSILGIKQDVKLLNDKVVYYTVKKTLERIIARRGIKPEDIDHFLPHFSSYYFKPKVMEELEGMGFPIPEEKWYTNLSTKGNTGSASIYIMLEEFVRSKNLKTGEKILCYVPESGRFSSGFMLLTAVEN